MNKNNIEQIFAVALSQEPYFSWIALERQLCTRLNKLEGPTNRFRIGLLMLSVVFGLLTGILILTSTGSASDIRHLTGAIASASFRLSMWQACLISLICTAASLFGTKKYLRNDI